MRGGPSASPGWSPVTLAELGKPDAAGGPGQTDGGARVERIEVREMLALTVSVDQPGD